MKEPIARPISTISLLPVNSNVTRPTLLNHNSNSLSISKTPDVSIENASDDHFPRNEKLFYSFSSIIRFFQFKNTSIFKIDHSYSPFLIIRQCKIPQEFVVGLRDFTEFHVRAGNGSRTHLTSLGSWCTTDVRYLQSNYLIVSCR